MLYYITLYSALAVCILLTVPTTVFTVECLVGSLTRQRKSESDIVIRPAVAVLVPAHDESEGIADTVRSIRHEMRQGDRLVVIADNCSDDTAEIARSEGAEIVERHNLLERGKGYALDAGVRYLEATPPKVVVIIDADCSIGRGTLDYLACTVLTCKRPAQALNLQIAPPGSNYRMAAAEFAYLIKNQVRPLGLSQLGLPCPLMGTGMALPWALLRDANLASSHQVEDVKFSLDLAREGHTALFCDQAVVTSYFPHSKEGTETQQRRWERGHLSMIVRAARSIVWPENWTSLGYIVLLLDIIVPPFTLLCLASLTILLFSTLLAFSGDTTLPLSIALANVLMLFCSVCAAWAVHGRSVLPFRKLAQVPLYALSKIRLYPKLSAGHEIWVRTDRKRSDRAG